jgi:glucose/arabinose dehydrogenase
MNRLGDWMRSAGTKLRLAAILAGLAAILILPARAGAAVALQSVGTFSAPIFITAPPGDPRLFVVERAGRIQEVKNGVIQATPFLDIHTLVDSTNGERGLLSMAFDPNYATNGLFYVFFNDNGTAGASAGDIHVDEFHVTTNPDVIDSATRRGVLTIPHSAANHNGGQLQFGPDGNLYISVGDNTSGSNAQNTANLLGKISRINPHGATDGVYTVPPDNPYAGATPGLDEIWSLGLRNPFRFSFDHITGDLLIGDVGEGSREEVDDAPLSAGLGGGANYGWPCREGFIAGPAGPGPCSGTLTNPIFDYPHSNPGGGAAFGCAIIGGYVYRGNQVPELAGRYAYADLCTSVVRSNIPALPLASDDRSDAPIGAMPNSFGEDSSCNLYVAAASTVSRIVSTSPPAVAPGCVFIPPSQTPASGAGPGAAAQPFFQPRCKKHRKHHKRKHCKKKKKKKRK